MIRRYTIMGAVVATSVALASCGGGSPTPSPTPTPTPTPTASATYTAFPLTTATEFTALSAATSYTGDPTAGAVTLGTANTDALSYRVRLAAQTAINTTAEWVLHENTDESRFTSTNLITPSATTNPEFVFRIDDATTAGKFAQGEFLNNVLSGTVTSDAGLALTEVSWANWYRGDSTTGQKRLTYSLWGYQTVASDMPTTGTVSYATRFTGRLISVTGTTAVNKIGGTSTVTVNFDTGQVDVTLNLTTIDPTTGVETPYANFTAQGAIPSGQTAWTGSFLNSSPLSGTLQGTFYGSQGVNMGLTFAASGTIGGAQQRLVGVLVGKKP